MIRPFNNNDLDIFIHFAGEFYSSSAVDHKIPEANFRRTFDECIKDSPYCHGVMIECDGKPVGFALLALTYSNEAGGLCVWVEEIFIAEVYRNRGLGKEFFDYIYATFPSAARFRLEVTRSNGQAMGLYSRLGYQELDYMQMIKDTNKN